MKGFKWQKIVTLKSSQARILFGRVNWFGAGTKIKVPEEFYFREIELQKKRGAKLHKLANASETTHKPPFNDEYTYEDYLAGKVDDRGYKPPPSV